MDYEVIFADYCQIIDGIFHYQNHQIELKMTTLKIMLGTFAIIGLLAFSNIGLTNYWFLLICSTLPLLSLMVITIGSVGIDQYNIKTNTFKHYSHDFENHNSISSNVLAKTWSDSYSR